MMSHKATVFDEVCNVFNNNLSIFNSITITSGSEICNPVLERLATFCAEIIENLFLELRKRFFWGPIINYRRFPGEHAPGKSASAVACQSGQQYYIGNLTNLTPALAKMLDTSLQGVLGTRIHRKSLAIPGRRAAEEYCRNEIPSQAVCRNSSQNWFRGRSKGDLQNVPIRDGPLFFSEGGFGKCW